jgi:hypothetical protein
MRSADRERISLVESHQVFGVIHRRRSKKLLACSLAALDCGFLAACSAEGARGGDQSHASDLTIDVATEMATGTVRAEKDCTMPTCVQHGDVPVPGGCTEWLGKMITGNGGRGCDVFFTRPDGKVLQNNIINGNTCGGRPHGAVVTSNADGTSLWLP